MLFFKDTLRFHKNVKQGSRAPAFESRPTPSLIFTRPGNHLSLNIESKYNQTIFLATLFFNRFV